MAFETGYLLPTREEFARRDRELAEALQKEKERQDQFHIEVYKEAGANRRSLHTNRWAILGGVVSTQLILAGAYNYMFNNITVRSSPPQTITAFFGNVFKVNWKAYVELFDNTHVLSTAQPALFFIPLLALVIIIGAWLLERRLRDLYIECTVEGSNIEKKFGILTGVYSRLLKPRRAILDIIDHTHAFNGVVIGAVLMWSFLFYHAF
ncbi:MAG TPA: hypothetical protein VHF05_00610 [Candidatus Paceibacterota bacterium]|jgi:hypothetical protein|nr:hypothetical protein [Candidatus Paceibacterota bacterium]